jgi:hypothetical protein
MKAIWLEHEKHGRKVCYMDVEAEADRGNGWFDIPEPGTDNAISDPFAEFTRKDLFEYALDRFGIELNKRAKKEDLINEIRGLMQ